MNIQEIILCELRKYWMKSNEEKILEVTHTIETKCGSQHELSVAELIDSH